MMQSQHVVNQHAHFVAAVMVHNSECLAAQQQHCVVKPASKRTSRCSVLATKCKQPCVAHLVLSQPRCRLASCATKVRAPAIRAETASCGSSGGRAFLERASLPWLRGLGSK